jgi:hypothetical protein
MTNLPELRQQLHNMLIVRQAYMDFDDAVADFPTEHINTKPPHTEYSFWHLLEHLRICQHDILEYIQAEDYTWPNFPDDLWPDFDSTTDTAGWEATLKQFRADRQALADLVMDPAVDLFAPLPNSGKHQHTILRSINIIASHNAYHLGEFAILRGVLGLWGQTKNPV